MCPNILISSDYHSGNEYVKNVFTHLQKINPNFKLRFSAFHKIKNPRLPDILHIQWLEELFPNWEVSSSEELDSIIGRLEKWKKKTKLVWTIHNHQAHTDVQSFQKLYDYISQNADGVIHLGNWSKEFLKNKINPKTIQTVIPHPNYTVSATIDQSLARQKLSLPLQKRIILVYGAIRKKKEKDRILELCDNLDNVLILVPRWQTGKSFLGKIAEKLKIAGYDNLKANNAWVDKRLEHILFSAADVVFIPRENALNSGSLILSFNYEKVVIGSDFGNIGEILRLSNNPIFKNKNSMIEAIENGIELSKNNKGKENLIYSKKNWAQEEIAKKHLKFYEEVLSDNTCE